MSGIRRRSYLSVHQFRFLEPFFRRAPTCSRSRTIMAIPDYRMQAPDKTIISFNERPSGQPEALKAWFYPGDNYGVEFVYPKQRATELAQANQQPVLSTREEMTDTPSMKSATVEPVAPPTVRVAD